MRRESGISVILIVAVLAVLAAGGAGFFAWQSMGQLEMAEKELNTNRATLSKALADARKATSELAAVSKEAKDSKAAVERLTAERDSLRVGSENGQAVIAQLRAELAVAEDQVKYLASRSSKEVVRGMPKGAGSK